MNISFNYKAFFLNSLLLKYSLKFHLWIYSLFQFYNGFKTNSNPLANTYSDIATIKTLLQVSSTLNVIKPSDDIH